VPLIFPDNSGSKADGRLNERPPRHGCLTPVQSSLISNKQPISVRVVSRIIHNVKVAFHFAERVTIHFPIARQYDDRLES